MLPGVAPPVAAAPAKHHTRQAQKAKPGVPGARVKAYKLDDELARRSGDLNPRNTTRVIVTLVPGATLPAEFKKFGQNRNLDIINGQVLDLPNNVLRKLAAHPNVFQVHYDRPTRTHNNRTAVTVGARDVFWNYGYTGAGVGVAVIDSGITSWHDDMVNYTKTVFPYGNQRVAKFVDFVNGRALPYDDNGHGTHVSGIIGGVGYDSKFFEKAGIAPLASIVSLKVLDQNGYGTVSNLIAALDWVAVNHKTYNIRVVNMSVGAGVHESYWTDPLTLAAKAVTDKGITIVAAAGNLGKNAAGALQYGGISAPGNAPWVLTVGASSTMGTTNRADDQMAPYSSSGPTAYDFGAKPDLVAPGTGTVSLAAAGSTFAVTKSEYLVYGFGANKLPVYLALSGTSMAAPVVSGTVALMLQANPNLTPNLIKAILQYTAQVYPGYSALRQGAGFLNTLGAVRLAKHFATAAPGARTPVESTWSRKLIWGNHQLTGGYIKSGVNAWGNTVVWGSARTLGVQGENIAWGTNAMDENIVWGTSWVDSAVESIVWGTNAIDENIVWGTDCGGADCENIVWGTLDALENIVWGTCEGLENIVWGTDGLENIVWGTSGPDVTWASDSEDAVTFPAEEEPIEPQIDPNAVDTIVTVDETTVPTADTTVTAPDTTVSPETETTVPLAPIGTLSTTGGL
ncbi:MAG TPA: S8 family peptidase [Vicinamibacterales bacterium]|jgi:serine protease AprX|nr:S8 family peptidase [Vicinamibacterales bacterium]